MIKTVKPKVAPDQSIQQRSTESRIDPLTGDWTIFAPHRDDRPEEFVDHNEVIEQHLDCPFCPGNEANTPPSVWEGQVSDDESSDSVAAESPSDDWSVRVVPNKYPAVDPIHHRPPSDGGTGLFKRASASGGHEVIIESRQHVQSITSLDLAEIQLVFQAYQSRMKYWREVPGISYISTFKNVGGLAGASLQHTHSQLIATDTIPPAVESSVKRMRRHRAATGCCLQCDIIRAELKAKQRMVWHDDSVVAFCPFASRLPMLITITTREHEACFEDLSEQAIESVSRLVVRVVSWLERVQPGASYNYCLHTRPPGDDDNSDSYHWSLEIFPRLSRIAGFEWSSRSMINPILPETAAAKYRSCAKSEDPRIAI